tara:strand:- start:1066 stop:3933 length:2868 start_codon:yes stop_codon:yes gene_type:complete
MAISPQDYSLWARRTGNRYPTTAREKAAVGPEVKRFVDNMAKQEAQGKKSEEKREKINITGKQIATGALAAGLVAGGVAAARRKGVQDSVKLFLSNLGDKLTRKTYTSPNQGDITPPPVQQQVSTGMQPLSEGVYSSLLQQTTPENPNDNNEQAGGAIPRKPAPKPPNLPSAMSQEDMVRRGQALNSFQKTLLADGNTVAAERVGKELTNLRQQYKENFLQPNTNTQPADTTTKASEFLNKLQNINPSNLSNSEQQKLEYLIDETKGRLNSNAEQERQELNKPKPKPKPGTISGRDLSPAEKEKALAQAKLQEFAAEKYGVSKTNVAAIRQAQIESGNLKDPRNTVVSKPSAKNDEFYTKDELNAMGGIDKIRAGLKNEVGVRTQKPNSVKTDVKNTALLANADNNVAKINKIIGDPTLKSEQDTEMLAAQKVRRERNIQNYRNEYNKIYDTFIDQFTGNDPSKITERIEANAARLANKTLNNPKNYKQFGAITTAYKQAIREQVDEDTKLSGEDASFVASAIFDEDTGKAATANKDDGGGEIKRSMRNMKSVKNLETGQKTPNNRAIRGRGRNLDQGELSQEQTRDVGEASDIADVQGGLIGSTLASGSGLPAKGVGSQRTEAIDVPVIVRKEVVNANTGKVQTVSYVTRGTPIQTESLPLGVGKQTRAPRQQVRKQPEVNRPDIVMTADGPKPGKGDFVIMDGKKVLRETLSGYSPYGKEVGKFISGAMDTEGEYSKEAAGFISQGPGQPLLDAGATFVDPKDKKTRLLRNQPGAPQPRKPSEPLFGDQQGVDTRREKGGLGTQSNEMLRSRIRTDRSGNLTRTSRDAKIELLRRGATIPTVPTRTNGQGAKSTINFTGASTPLEAGQRGPASSLQNRPPIGGSDPTDEKRLGADFTRQQRQRAIQGLQDIERNLPLDERPAARQRLLSELSEARKIREGGGYDLSKDIQELP